MGTGRVLITPPQDHGGGHAWSGDSLLGMEEKVGAVIEVARTYIQYPIFTEGKGEELEDGPGRKQYPS
ncbi:MAG: hypothetical protein ACETWB_10025 [Anaerolineae bacterium]